MGIPDSRKKREPPVSLHPLDFETAMKGLLEVDPGKPEPRRKPRKKREGKAKG